MLKGLAEGRGRLASVRDFLVSTLFLAMALVCAHPGAAAADEVKLHLESVNLEKLPFVKTYISLIGSDGKPVREKSGFRLLVDGVEQKDVQVLVTPLAEAKEPTDVIAVVQISAVMEPAIKNVRTGIEKLAKQLAKIPESRLAIISYGTEVKRLEEYGRPNEIARDLDKLAIDPDASEAKMVDALRVAIDLSRERQDRRRIVVLFSDGIDVSPGKDVFADVGKRAQQAGVVIDTIGFAPFEAGRLRSLIDISRMSAGTSRGARSVNDIVERYLQVADELGAVNAVSFGLTTAGDNAQHELQVAYRQGKDDLVSEKIAVTLPPFEPADSAGRSWQWWLAVVGLSLFGLVILLYIIGRLMGG